MACNKFQQGFNYALKNTHFFHSIKFVESHATYQITNKLLSTKSNRCLAQSCYSTLQKNNKYLNIPKQRFTSTLFLSTQGASNETFQVVVTDPSKPISEFTSGISNIEDVSKVLTESGVNTFSTNVEHSSDIAATLSNEIQTIIETAEPSLASLGLANHTPVGLVQIILENLHISYNMPWWAAIATCTVIARILLLPILIKTQRNTTKMSNHMPQLQYLQAKFGEARRSGNTMEASRLAAEIMQFMKEHDISPIKNALLPMAQAPVFISFFLALRTMAKTPVESMKYGGIWWVSDLTIPDPYYILPIVSCSTLYIVLKIGAESGIKLDNMKMAKYVLQAVPIILLPFCINFPSAVLFYWCTTNFCTLLIVSILKIPPVRQFLKLPAQRPIDPKFVAPKKSFVSGIKEAFEDQKALATVEDRRRIDDIRFQKAGTGPITRTYSYDPTKVKPSSVAAAAKQAISAKEHNT